MWIDLHDGPLIAEVPPGVLGAIDDHWYHWVVDVGLTGPDRGKGSGLDKGFHANDDGSVDVWFAPTVPDGEAGNWVQAPRQGLERHPVPVRR